MNMSPGEMMARDVGAPRQGAESGMPQAVESNPVAGAFRTMMLYVAAEQDKGNPAADQMQEGLRMFVEAVGGGMPAGGPAEPVQPTSPQPPGPVPMSKGVNPMVGNMAAQARPTRQGVQVI
jgi:hypothetical protein